VWLLQLSSTQRSSIDDIDEDGLFGEPFPEVASAGTFSIHSLSKMFL
jgi:hypothetical protein